MRRLVALALLMLIASCGQPANLEPLLIQSGDLPAGMSAGQVSENIPPIYADAPKPVRFIRQQFARGDEPAGAIAVLIYDQAAERDQAYTTISNGMGGATPLPDIAERAGFSYLNIGLPSYDFVFQRCRAIVHMRMVGESLSADNLEAYAKRLDSRLRPAVC